MRQLVFVHGRAQHDKDAAELKQTWIKALEKGLKKSDLELPISHDKIRFPYFGDTLRDLVAGLQADEVAKVIVKGVSAGGEEAEFIRQYLLEVQNELHIDEAEIRAEVGQTVLKKGPENWEWLQAVLSVIDRRIPGASGATLALLTKDVYRYLRNPGINHIIDSGVQEAFSSDAEQVVVSHSLGTVVAYNLMRRVGTQSRWRVPLFVTLGSPLAVNVIKTSLAPIGHAACVGKWLNALDTRDVVALYSLDRHHFNISPEIENHTKVDNHTDNRHGIIGYLDDEFIARQIHAALVAP